MASASPHPTIYSGAIDTPRGKKADLYFLDILAFFSFHPAQALLNSTPQFLARDRRAIAQGGAAPGGVMIVSRDRKRSGKRARLNWTGIRIKLA
jgi:hypothetical protein